MGQFGEADTVQAGVVDRLTTVGWKHVPGSDLARSTTQVMIEDDVREALLRLNPAIAEKPDRANEMVPRLRAAILSVGDEGLTPANQRFTEWLRGLSEYRFVGVDKPVPIRLVDFDDPHANRLVFSDEVVCVGAVRPRRYDVVLWVNGVPLVVIETKPATDKNKSWLNGACDIHDVYEVETPQFFVPSLLSAATEGKEFHYAAIGQPADSWLVWGSTADPPAEPLLSSVLRQVELLADPATLLTILSDFALFTRSTSVGSPALRKLLPRYPQVEATRAIIARIKDPLRRQGLVWHHQGSGKTLTMAFVAGMLRRDLEMDAPTILVVLDRLDLFEQVIAEFRAAGYAHLRIAHTRDDLRRQLAEDARGVIVTTIFRFADAGRLNERRNIVVLVDEAHRTQEGTLGEDMRAALPYATFIGLTGTPVSEGDRNTRETFGDPGDPERVLNRYPPDRSIADGATLPVHVETRLVDFHIDTEDLDAAFAELAEEEGLSEAERALLARKAGRIGTLLAVPQRVRAVAVDIVDHYRERIAPLGLKAQVVVYDRALCVAYQQAISALLGDGEESTVVMTVNTAKEADPDDWQVYDRDRAAENAVRKRFRDPDDPLRFLIVTSKLLTGFDAPIEGVMYLDKPLRAHNLFQAITRTNRRYTNPATGQEKQFGLVVDYVGLGSDIAKALALQNTGAGRRLPPDVGELHDELGAVIETCLARFAGVDRTTSGFAALAEAQERLRTAEERAAFAEEFLRAEALYEFLSPAPQARRHEADYRWLAKIYASVTPSGPSNALLWRRLGAKTTALIAAHVDAVTIERIGPDQVVMDAESIEVIRQLGLELDLPDRPEPPTAEQVLDSIAARLARRLSGPHHPVYDSLATRLDDLRRQRLASAEESVEFLKRLLEVARDVVAAGKADDEGRLDEVSSALLDPRIGALTQIFREYAPEATPQIIATVVHDIDEIVRQVRFAGWQQTVGGDRDVRRELRKTLNKHGLGTSGPVFDRAYAYIRENY